MNICLKTEALQAQKRHIQLTITERLPERVMGPISLLSDVSVEVVRPHYLLTLLASGVLTITCQRCLGVFQHDYRHCSQLAVYGAVGMYCFRKWPGRFGCSFG